MLPIIINQYKHMHWANQELIKRLRQVSSAPAGAIELMSHIVAAEHIWLARISGQKETLAPWSKLTLKECKEFTTRNCDGYIKTLLHLNEERLHEPISFKLKSGESMSSTLGDILCHVPPHGAHHRGQIASILSKNALKPPAMDYIIYSSQAAE